VNPSPPALSPKQASHEKIILDEEREIMIEPSNAKPLSPSWI
jgi:hypothetical protein